MHAAVIFLSAFLLFQVELIIAKHLLPWFGGTPAVWTTCLLFFQFTLLAGYAYAHVLVSGVPRRAAGWLHAALLAAAGAALWAGTRSWGGPLLPAAGWRPDPTQSFPALHLLRVLAAAVGLPFFALAAASPLLQQWFGDLPGSRRPYRLYALSNLGSMLGLLSYPFAVEPLAGLPTQAAVWTALFAVCAALTAVCALRAAPRGPAAAAAAPGPAGDVVLTARAPAPRLADFAAWILLPLCTSALLLSVTNELCQEVAAVPLLWVLPLAVYLLTFIAAFAEPRGCQRRRLFAAAAAATAVSLLTAFLSLDLHARWHVLSLGGLLFALGLLAHAELVRLKPAAGRLTSFYLAVSSGGALGGALVALAAPLLLRDLWEFHLSLIATWLVLAWVLWRDRRSVFFTGDRLAASLVLFAIAYAAIRFGAAAACRASILPAAANTRLAAAAVAGALAVAAGVRGRKGRLLAAPGWPRLLAAVVLLAAESGLLHRMHRAAADTVASARNFYGVVRVRRGVDPASGERFAQMSHGRITHGYQFLSPELRRTPAGYFAGGSGVSFAFEYHPRNAQTPPQPLRIGVTGLGAGTLAAYAGRGDVIRFYEINPQVIAYAREQFSYLADCEGQVDIVPGDARLSLEREWRTGGSQRFDILVLDAFSSDSVPVHLLTLEAFELYLRHLRGDDGIIAVNISNRYLDFRPLLDAVARRLDLGMAWLPFGGAPPMPAASSWVLLSRNRSFFDLPDVREHARPCAPRRPILWTDAYSGILHLLLGGPPALRTAPAAARPVPPPAAP